MDVIHYTRDVPPDHPFSPPPVLPSDYEQTPPPVQMTTPPLVLLLTLDTKEDDPPEKVCNVHVYAYAYVQCMQY